MTPPTETIHQRLMREYWIAWERFLVGRFEEYLGRVPRDFEVEAFAYAHVWPSGRRAVFWRGKLIGSFASPLDWAKENFK